MVSLRELTIEAAGRRVVDALSLELGPGRVVALVGPSGAGKSLTARSIVRLNPPGVRVGGSVLVGDRDVLTMNRRELRELRGRRIGYAFQDAVGSLNPTITVGRHLTETVRALNAGDPRDLGPAALRRCGLDDALWDAHPYELSGGQAQRAALALATVLEPELLIADEVTTALDPVTQAAVLDAVRAQAVEQGRAVLLITHDIAVAGRWADEIAVLSEGRLVEHGPATDVLTDPQTTFARALVAAARLETPSAEGLARHGVLEARGVRRVLRGRGRTTLAVDGVDLEVAAGEAVAVVGRSGSGKSTLVGMLAALDRPDDGELLAGGRDVWALPDRERRALRRQIGLVFQDALASFDPRYRVRQVVAEADAGGDVGGLPARVGLDAGLAERRPATLSGGERQRVALARALAARPTLLLADEPTTGARRARAGAHPDLACGLRREDGLGVVFVTHDLRVARRIADRVVVLAGGRIVEECPAGALAAARHPETRALLAATPALVPENTVGRLR